MSIRAILLSLGLVALLAPVGCIGEGPKDGDDEDVESTDDPLIIKQPISLCNGDMGCPEGQYCSSTGACKTDKPLGGNCNRAAQCESGICVDGVCSDIVIYPEPTGGSSSSSSGTIGGFPCHADPTCAFCDLDGFTCLVSYTN